MRDNYLKKLEQMQKSCLRWAALQRKQFRDLSSASIGTGTRRAGKAIDVLEREIDAKERGLRRTAFSCFYSSSR